MVDRSALVAFAEGGYAVPEAREIWQNYLNKYLGIIDWVPVLAELVAHVERKGGQRDPDVYNQIAAAMLMPAVDRSLHLKDEPQRFLFGCASFPKFGTDFRKFGKNNWIEVLQDIVKDDARNIQVRDEAANLGFIEKIEYQPMTRQALRWLKEKAVDSGVELTAENELKYKELVQSYGGALICNIFTRHENRIKEVLNWHTPYFFERLIHRIYTPEQIFNIKKKELDENPRLIAKAE